jgi:formylglycine-generating enzyme
MKLRLIPAGEFMMGSGVSAAALAKQFEKEESDYADEHPQHRVRITQPFYLGQHEVTVGQFRRFVADSSYKTEAESDGKGGYGFDLTTGKYEQDPKYTWKNPGFAQRDDHPVVNVSWNDAVAFCSWLSREEGEEYRLPTEAEWEFACRGGTTTMYQHGDNPEGLAFVGNIADGTFSAKLDENNLKLTGAISAKDGYAATAPVGDFRANPFGLHDMHGNVYEWCSDWYGDDYYKNSPASDPGGPSTGSYRVSRGGSWFHNARYCRSANRNRFTPGLRFNDLGFRVLRSSIK